MHLLLGIVHSALFASSTTNHLATSSSHQALTGVGRLTGVVVSVLATGPKVAGSNPAEAMDF
jgi:hypothetical protein